MLPSQSFAIICRMRFSDKCEYLQNTLSARIMNFKFQHINLADIVRTDNYLHYLHIVKNNSSDQ